MLSSRICYAISLSSLLSREVCARVTFAMCIAHLALIFVHLSETILWVKLHSHSLNWRYGAEEVMFALSSLHFPVTSLGSVVAPRRRGRICCANIVVTSRLCSLRWHRGAEEDINRCSSEDSGSRESSSSDDSEDSSKSLLNEFRCYIRDV